MIILPMNKCFYDFKKYYYYSYYDYEDDDYCHRFGI